MEYHLTEAYMQGLLMQNCRVIVYIDDITRIHIPQEYPKIHVLHVLKAFAI